MRKESNPRNRKNQKRKTHDNMRTWLHPALSSPAGLHGLSHVQQNYTDTTGGLKLDIPGKARTRQWERCFTGDGLSWGGGG